MDATVILSIFSLVVSAATLYYNRKLYKRIMEQRRQIAEAGEREFRRQRDAAKPDEAGGE
jgi:hypothetical protein